MSISKIIKNGENTTVEFKESMNDSAYKTISAFANTEGGILLCGVSDDGDIVGAECSDQVIRNIIDRIANMEIYPSISPIEEKGEKILEIGIEKSYRPISYRGRYYKRVGNTTREMQGEELITFFQQWSSWDTLTGDYNINEIDKETFNKFIRLAVNSGRLPEDKNESLIETLRRLRLIKDEKLTNAAIMLFGKNPQKYFINAVVRVGKFKDEITIVGDTLVEGNLFQQVEMAEKAIKSNINVRYEIEGLVRKDIWDYPLEAIREALMNAIVHRDYFKNNVQIQIKIFDDRIWVFNIGGLPAGITIEQLKDVHTSVPRNSLIVHVFYLAGLIEELGSGIKRMMNSLNKEGLPEPEFKEEFGGFSTYLRKKNYSEEYLKEKGLNDRQIKALKYVVEHGHISASQYSKIAPDIKERTIQRDLKYLIEKKFIIKVGKARQTRYELVKE